VALYSGAHGAPDLAGALRWFSSAAEAGNPEAAFNVGSFHDDGVVVPKDEAKAAEWYGKAAEAGVPAAMHTLGLMLATGRGVPRDLKRGAEMLRLAREEGDTDVEDDVRQFLESLTPDERARVEAELRR
jgi:TPR repeat protein